MATPDTQITGLKRQLAGIDTDLARHRQQLKDLEYFVNHNRFDRDSTREADEEISWLHNEINALNMRRAPIAQQLKSLELAQMHDQYHELAQRAGQIEDRMDNIEINLMYVTERTPEVMASSNRDYLQYQREYQATVRELSRLAQKMRKYQEK